MWHDRSECRCIIKHRTHNQSRTAYESGLCWIWGGKKKSDLGCSDCHGSHRGKKSDFGLFSLQCERGQSHYWHLIKLTLLLFLRSTTFHEAWGTQHLSVERGNIIQTQWKGASTVPGQGDPPPLFKFFLNVLGIRNQWNISKCEIEYSRTHSYA